MYLMQVAAVPGSYRELIAHASTEVVAVLVVLAILSLLSWTIMILKWREFRTLRGTTRSFMREFEGLSRLDEAMGLVRRSEPSPFTRVFTRAVRFLPEAHRVSSAGGSAAPAGGAALTASQVEALGHVLESETMDERERLQRFIPWLATIGSASPLIGLLGTVLGVINAFIGIAQSGAGNIAAVAPGVAEALIATAGALCVAIPAVFGYNHFANQVNQLDGELEGFSSEIVALLVREGRI